MDDCRAELVSDLMNVNRLSGLESAIVVWRVAFRLVRTWFVVRSETRTQPGGRRARSTVLDPTQNLLQEDIWEATYSVQ